MCYQQVFAPLLVGGYYTCSWAPTDEHGDLLVIQGLNGGSSKASAWCRFDSAKCGFDQRVEAAEAHATESNEGFLKHVAFGVNASQYYVESEWGTHWRSGPFDTFSRRQAAGNSTVASYASFGPNHQHYIEFPDWIYWKIDDAEIRRLVKEKQPVKFVSFGPQGAVVLVLKNRAYYFRYLAFDWAVRDSTS